MSKASEKREKVYRETLVRKLTVKLRTFRNLYLGDYVSFKKEKINSEIEKKEYLISNPLVLLNLNTILRNETPESRRRWYTPICIKALELEITRLKGTLVNEHINTFDWITTANESFEDKFSRLIEKLVKFKMDIYELKIDSVGCATNRDFGFIISDKNSSVHARVIYANGEIKAPHYRFIVTKRSI